MGKKSDTGLVRYFAGILNTVTLSQLQIIVPGMFQLARMLDKKAFAPIERRFPESEVMESAELLSGLFSSMSFGLNTDAFRILSKYWKSKTKK